MTTHDQHADQSRQFATENPNYIPEDQVAPTRDDVTATHGAGPPTAPMDPQVAGAQHHPDQHHGEEHHDGRETDPEAGLFAHDELAGLRARWDAVQASFVDDPKDCVQKADSLVADLVQQLTTGFGQARSRLEDQWSRGEQASTEDLRVALKRYRSFFERLLTV
ncbi:hypothetical protein [Mycobacterium sp. PSTR-4-N]|uniref:hypothetical protein n=1 Tax=Mycobacterium sp. PSTR-4-N TaxID=2917745 RepID=UPI001F14B413|nr:hypothetical protein [Mycobacterium sp. PSTR-4-N]MCG7595286.1 hypothetical protein [Mycobacterium sp. PSTR-4-N]